MTSLTARNVAVNYANIGGQVLVALIVTPYLILTLGDERYGLWSIIAAFAGYLMLMDLGIVSAITRSVAHLRARGDGDDLDGVLSSAAVLLCGIAALIVLLAPFTGSIVVFLIEIPPELESTVRLCVFLATLEVAVFVLGGFYRGVLAGHHRFDLVYGLILAGTILRAVLIVLVLASGYGLVAMSIVTLSMTITLAFGARVLARRVLPPTSISLSRADRGGMRSVSTFARATFVSMLAAQLVYYTDAFVIGHFIGAAAVAYYTIAWSLAEYVNRLMVAVSRVFMPLFSEREVEGGRIGLYAMYADSVRYQLLISNLICIGLWMLGGPFIEVWIDASYARICVPILQLLLIAQILRGPQLLGYALLQGVARHRWYSNVNLGFAFANLALSVVLAERYGLLGVATATCLTQSLFNGIVAPGFALKILGVSAFRYIRDTWLRTMVPATVLVVALAVFGHWRSPERFTDILVQASAGAALYSLAAVTVSLSRPERSRLFKRLAALFGARQAREA